MDERAKLEEELAERLSWMAQSKEAVIEARNELCSAESAFEVVSEQVIELQNELANLEDEG